MRYFILAGEASADLHAADLIRHLRQLNPAAEIMGMGGDRMQAAGCQLVLHYRQMAFMGLVAVLKNAGQVRRNFRLAKQTLLSWQPDVLVLLDYPSFNLRIASFVRHTPQLASMRIIYYIPPKVWAWKRWRIHQIARLSDQVLGIFPFEPPFYQQYGYQCTYVGNPTYEQLAANALSHSCRSQSPASDTRSLALLPGSRRHEVEMCLPRMLQVAQRLLAEHTISAYWVARAPGVDEAIYQGTPRYEGTTQQLLSCATAAIVNSGTATLEAAIIGCPQVAVYHIAGGWFTMHVLRPIFFSIHHFTLVNILAGHEVITELIGDTFTPHRLYDATRALFTDPALRERMQHEYAALRTLLHTDTPAALAAAKIVVEQVEQAAMQKNHICPYA